MLPLTLGCLWLIVANLIAVLPTRDHHWRAAYALMAAGLPLLIWITATQQALWSAAFLLAAASILRWPLWHLWRWTITRFTAH